MFLRLYKDAHVAVIHTDSIRREENTTRLKSGQENSGSFLQMNSAKKQAHNAAAAINTSCE